MELVGTFRLIDIFIGFEVVFPKFLEIPKFVLDVGIFPGRSIKRSSFELSLVKFRWKLKISQLLEGRHPD